MIPIGLISSGYYNWASPLVVNGYAYVGVASRCDQPLVWGGLLKVSLTSHSVVGFFNTTVGGNKTRGSSIWGSPTYVAATNAIYVATGNPLKTHVTNWSEAVIAVNATTLAPIGKWQVPLAQTVKDSDFGTTPDYYHLPGGQPQVSAMNKNGFVYTLNATNLPAGPVWESQVSTQEYPGNVAPLAWGDGLLFDGSGPTNISGKNYSGGLRAFYPGNGTVKWAHGFRGDVFGAPAYANGIVVAAGGTALDVFNASTGQLLWNWPCPASFNSGPTIAEGRIIAACSETYAFGFLGVSAGPMVPAGGMVGPPHPTTVPPTMVSEHLPLVLTSGNAATIAVPMARAPKARSFA
ncbi:MAG: PQQ-binding-like beta-propeller repeat protein [Thermoplasmata archaeon]|nr:PQQ-binding-like beta-propeller repeat protein [Thermoplasmata archaeon]